MSGVSKFELIHLDIVSFLDCESWCYVTASFSQSQKSQAEIERGKMSPLVVFEESPSLVRKRTYTRNDFNDILSTIS